MSSLVTDEVKALIGLEAEPIRAALPVSLEGLRRFTQGVMETNPVHWDADAAAASKYSEIVAVPLYPPHTLRRAPGTPDPLDVLDLEPDADGSFRGRGWGGLPFPELPLKRLVNGGTGAEFFQLAKVGDVISAQSKYVDITEKMGRTGPMVIFKIQTTYRNQDGDVLAVITAMPILR